MPSLARRANSCAWVVLCWAIGSFAWAEPVPPAVERKVQFRRDVYPLLVTHCFECHKGSDASAGVRLDLKAELLGETNGKPLVVPGNSADSRLIHLVAGTVPNRVMPKKGPRLTAEQVGVLRAWIDQGLDWDAELAAVKLTSSDHWAFQPVRRPKGRIGIDDFLRERHLKETITPNPEAEPRVLVRRLYLDLLGLPPTAEAVDEFVAAWETPGAKREAVYRSLVDTLLASPHYGERWARHWLDLARWAETEGYESNHTRPYAWRYRDYVVKSFNDDKPFDRFLREQLAGDELTPYSDENVIATGFLAAARLSSNEEDRYRLKNDIYTDIVNATASSLLGLTFQCAQCHNHKFDPISARDYYRFLGFFVQGQPANLALRAPGLTKDYLAKKPAEYDALARERDTLFETARSRRIVAVKQALPADTLHALNLPMEKRTPEQETRVRQADLLFQFTPAGIEKALTPAEKQRYDEVKKALAGLEKDMLERPQTFGFYSPITSPHTLDVLPMKGFYPLEMRSAELARAKAFLLVGGDVHKPSFAVGTGWPAVFGAEPKTPTRRALADWLTDRQNPLTARVFVNRLWQYHFGRGLVATASDFGSKGSPPTHPELLDWLAAEFLDSGWSVKHVHRLIVTSAAFRRSSRIQPAAQERDPTNTTWWRFDLRRLEAEAIRDSVLAVSGELDRHVGGPSTDAKSLRRSLYLFQKRDLPPQQQSLFDGPGAMTESCARRLTTTVPLQSLYLLNNEFAVQRARSLARRVETLAGDESTQQIETAFRLTLSRRPSPSELTLAQRFFQNQTDRAALARFCQALLNVNEFVYIE